MYRRESATSVKFVRKMLEPCENRAEGEERVISPKKEGFPASENSTENGRWRLQCAVHHPPYSGAIALVVLSYTQRLRVVLCGFAQCRRFSQQRAKIWTNDERVLFKDLTLISPGNSAEKEISYLVFLGSRGRALAASGPVAVLPSGREMLLHPPIGLFGHPMLH